jgi:hypothetical protein
MSPSTHGLRRKDVAGFHRANFLGAGCRRPRMVFVAPPGSSSPTLSTAAAPPQAICMATPCRRRSRRLPLRLSSHPAWPLLVVVGSPSSTSTSSTTSSLASSPHSRLHLLVYSDNRGLHQHSLPLCALQPSWRPSLLVSSPTWREVVSTGPVLRTPGTGNTGACLRP